MNDDDDNIDKDGDEIMDFPELDSPADFMESDHVQYTEEGEQDSPCLSNPDIFDDSSAYKTAQEAATVEITESTDSVPVSEDTLQITGATITADDDEPLPGPSYTEPKKDNSISGVLARIRERKRSLLTPKPDPDAASPETSPAVTPGGSQGPSGSQETPGGIPGTTAARRAILPEGGEMDIATADDVSKRSKDILNNLSTLMSSRPQLNAHARVQSWQADVAKLKNKLLMPHTIIAVVGDTGSGKSSLMNALLDHADILPTSGMRACTAVVVEITNNRLNGNYEADIEFLSAKEWDDELNFLLSELTDREGNLRHRQPDPKSEGGVAWSKIRAVYGAFPEGVTKAGLVRQNVNVTRWLGNVKRISEPNPKRFRRLIDHYIESTENGAGGDYWPIVKHVKVRIPNCEVCRSGATLVDLPGIRDSNAARDKIAKDFLRNCTAVWVVASIHRAVDDKTAKDLLGEHFRRQLLMDGQYGSVCFICTKTDVIVPSEIIRGLKLEDTVAPLEQEITGLETSAVDLLAELERLRAEMDDLDEALEEMEGECRGIEDSMTQPEVTEDESVSRHLSETLVENRQTLTDVRGRIKDLRRQKRDINQKLTENTSRADGLQRQITALCAKARNDYSKNQIRRDFRAGLKEMKRQAGLSEEDLEEDDGEDEDDEDRAGEDTDLQRTVDNLSVFCVSALEYLKLRRKLSKEDGEAQVFADTSDTGIPSLQQFVDDLTRQRRAEGTKRLVSCIGQTVIDVHHYLTDEGTKDHSIRGSAKSIYVQLLEGLKAECVSRIIGDSSERIDALFNTSLRPKAQEGVQAAVGIACDTVTKWGSKVNRDKPAEGGLYWATYKATVKRDGVYKSPTRGPIDFNEDLAGPMYASITIVWDRIFNSYLNNILENAKRSLLDSLSRFGDQMVSQLTFLGVQTDRVRRTRQQQITSASNKLAETIRGLKELIQEKQREVSRVITPSVQNSMRSAYTVCVQESGSGQFNRMRGHMIGHVNRDRVLIFDRASEQLLNNLLQLQNTIVAELRVVCDRVVQDLTAVYEPLWEAPDNTKVLRDNYLTGVMAVCLEIAALYRQLQLTAQPEFAVLDRPHVPVAATTPAATVVTAATQPANMVTMATPPPAAMHVTVGTTPASPQVSNQLLMQIQALQAKQQNAGGVQTVYLPIGAKSGQQYPLLQRQPFSLLQQNSPVVVTTGKASKKKGKVSATMTSAQAAVANQHSLLLAQQIARSVVGQATPNAPIRVRLPTSVVQNLPTVQAQNVHQSQAGMVSLLQTTGVRVAGPSATSTVTSGPGQPGVTMVKREPKSPKKKRPVNYGNAVIDLCEDDDHQSDIPTMKKKKKR